MCLKISVFSSSDSPARYNEKDQRSMLVWCPNTLLSDAMCKLKTKERVKRTNNLHLLIVTVCFLIPVDEYILMAKEKHGYNMEQV